MHTTMVRPLAIGALFGALLVLHATDVYAQTQAEFFNEQVLHEVRLFVNSRDYRLLRDRYQENIYVPADMVWKGLRVRNVGVRTRGTGSRNPTKLGLRVDFNRYTKKQQFLGLNSLILDNLWQDASLIREALAMSIYRRMGHPAPREAFARLYINNQYQGLYALVEPVDPVFLQRTIGENSGYLFEYHWVMPFYTEYLGDGLGPYRILFQPQNHELEAESLLYGPIRDLFREINEPDDAVWRTRVDERIDLAQFMTHAAIQGFLAQNDGLLGYAGLNNFYLYRFAGTNRHRLFPWDEDYAFTFIGSSLFRRGEQPVVLFERAFAEPDLRTVFLDAAEACARAITESGWLSAEIDRLVALIGSSVFEDTRKQYSNDDFLAGVDFLRAFAASRTEQVLAEVAVYR